MGNNYRKEVLDYMENLGRKYMNSLNELELDFVRSFNPILLIDKLEEVKKGTGLGKKYYQEMERFYDKYVNSDGEFEIKFLEAESFFKSSIQLSVNLKP